MSQQRADSMLNVFGPVPSRRLGRSLGVATIPPHYCTASCVYCQLGRTRHMTINRFPGAAPEAVRAAVADALAAADAHGEPVDAITLVADGEPTLDANLGATLKALAGLGPIRAVISNSTLVDSPAVRAELASADWVSLKLDGASEAVWRTVDRPHGRLRFNAMIEGMRRFSTELSGTLVTETMLVAGHNDDDEHLHSLAALAASIAPATAYLAAPVRPPAEPSVEPPDEATIVRAHQAFAEQLERVELMLGLPEASIASTGDPVDDLLATTAVHPIEEAEATRMLGGGEHATDRLDHLVATGQLARSRYRDRTFVVRSYRRPIEA
jgi:wyosine [tRNA(Phe)-imidazoG37] synthetase (radical SAM superfamily)